MNGLLLDTHVWIWVMRDQTQIPKRLRDQIEQSQRERRLYVSAFSIWELAQKESRGKLDLDGGLDLLRHEAFSDGAFQVAEANVDVLVLANRLPGVVHGDPADRIIIATAMRDNHVLLTHDALILSYAKQGHLKTLKV